MIDAVAWQRLEGGAAFVVSVLLYTQTGYGWVPFLLLLLLPDAAMLAYVAGPRAGAAVYNVAHSYALPLALAGAGLLLAHPAVIAAALVWTAHVGMDRALGYGLKLSSGFRDTHLGRIGREDAAGAKRTAR